MMLVVGATGALGQTIANALLDRGETLRILVRSGSDHAALVARGAHAAIGDLKDPATVHAACRDVRVVITTANSALRGGADDVDAVDLDGNRRLIDAAKAAGVEQFVFVSALVADAGSPVPFVAAKGKTERHLIASAMRYTILAPNAFMEFWIGGYIGGPASRGDVVTIAGEGRRLHSFVSMRDVAAFAVAVSGNARAFDRKLLIGGAHPLALMDAVGAYERKLRRSLTVAHVAPGGAIPSLPEPLWGLAASFDFFDSPVDMAAISEEFGVPATSLEDFVARTPGA